MKKIIGIYRVTSPTGCVYVGQSINIKRRWSEYKNLRGCGSDTRLYRSLKKHGFNKHKFDILEQCSQEELNNREIYYIELYQCFKSEFGMNLHSGGNNHTISEETRDKLRTSHLGQKVWNKGLTKEKDNRLKTQGEKHSEKMKGRKISKEHKMKISESNKGRIATEETKQKISKKLKGNKNGIGNTANLGRTLSDEVRLNMSKSKLKMRNPK